MYITSIRGFCICHINCELNPKFEYTYSKVRLQIHCHSNVIMVRSLQKEDDYSKPYIF